MQWYPTHAGKTHMWLQVLLTTSAEEHPHGRGSRTGPSLKPHHWDLLFRHFGLHDPRSCPWIVGRAHVPASFNSKPSTLDFSRNGLNKSMFAECCSVCGFRLQIFFVLPSRPQPAYHSQARRLFPRALEQKTEVLTEPAHLEIWVTFPSLNTS